jgi:site-specific DNA recombinase
LCLTGQTNPLLEEKERIQTAEQRIAEVREQIESNNREIVNEDEIAAALSVFDPIWETLGPKARARIIQLLVERVDYDGKAGTIAVTFRPNGIKTLVQQQLEEAA